MPHLTPAPVVCASADESYISDCTLPVLRCCTTSTIRYNRRNRTSLLMVPYVQVLQGLRSQAVRREQDTVQD